MFRRKSRRNIRSKRIRSRKNRNLSRRMKGGEPPSGEPPSTAHAIELNKITLCKYQVLKELRSEGDITEDVLTKVAKKLMLYRIGYSDDYPVSEYPNPMSIADIINTSKPDIQFLYIATNMECSGTVI
jgi:hypothetical protein